MSAPGLNHSDPGLGYPMPDNLRATLVREFWAPCQPNLHRVPDMTPYFDAYRKRCQYYLHDSGLHTSVRTSSGLVDLSQRVLGHLTRQEILSKNPTLQDGSTGDAKILHASLNLCASLLLMLDVGGHQYDVSDSNTLEWPEDQTLRQAVRQFFEQQRGVLEPEGAVLGKIFTARNLCLIGGLKIHWTTNVADHLRLSDEDQTISIFHLRSFLQFNESFAEPVFPDGLVKETLRTLALLFPQNDKKSRSWVKSQVRYANLDPSLASCGILRAQDRRFERFDFWRDRLIILKQAFDESSPRTLTQWWNDRRNSVQWYTFWVAIMVFAFTLFFGFVQSIEGALQVWLAWEGRRSK